MATKISSQLPLTTELMQDILIIFKDNDHYGLCLMATDSNHSEASFKNPKMSFSLKDKVAHSTRKGVVFYELCV